jgi:hypothetical protein
MAGSWKTVVSVGWIRLLGGRVVGAGKVVFALDPPIPFNWLLAGFGGYSLLADLHSGSFQTDFSRFSERGARLAVKPSYYPSVEKRSLQANISLTSSATIHPLIAERLTFKLLSATIPLYLFVSLEHSFEAAEV